MVQAPVTRRCRSVPVSSCSAGNYPGGVTATPAPRTAAPAPRTADEPGPGDGLVRIGALVFIVGAVATLVTVAPLFFGTRPFPTVAYLVSMLMGVGFLVAAAGVLRSVAAQRRQAKSAAQARSAASDSASAPATPAA
ncbi:hypothetical protein [Streptomyces liangshanensis]|uniref:hypothetical protein n=1 Tax=Streptomyces liangshanensis TaxID=2717324 RepID=UPI003C7A33D7